MFGLKGLLARDSYTMSAEAVERAAGTELYRSPEMEQSLRLWSDMYKNRPPWAGGSVRALNIPAAIASEFARLTTIELSADITGGARADFLGTVMDSVIADIRRQTEYACAMGGLIMKPYVSGGRIYIDYVQADCFYPVRFDNAGNITAAVFIERTESGGRVFSRLEHHAMENGRYIIRNTAFCSQSFSELGRQVPLHSLKKWARLNEETIIRNVSAPLFTYFKIPQANFIDTHSPLGVSVYAKAAGLIEDADRQYSRLLWEFESGERALYLDISAFKRDRRGNPVLPDKRLYRLIDSGTDSIFEDWTPPIREQSILNGLDAILAKIEDSCALARGTFSNAQTSAKTATELKILRQRTYASVTDIQKSLEKSLHELLYAADVLCSLYSLAPDGGYKADFRFDDSIMTDSESAFSERKQLFDLGIISAAELRDWYFGGRK